MLGYDRGRATDVLKKVKANVDVQELNRIQNSSVRDQLLIAGAVLLLLSIGALYGTRSAAGESERRLGMISYQQSESDAISAIASLKEKVSRTTLSNIERSSRKEIEVNLYCLFVENGPGVACLIAGPSDCDLRRPTKEIQ